MALYAIGDLHLSFQVECPVDMTQMGPEWVDHVGKIERNFFSELSDDDRGGSQLGQKTRKHREGSGIHSFTSGKEDTYKGQSRPVLAGKED